MICSTERVAVIVVRMWVEEPSGALRARVTYTDDVRTGEQHSEPAANAAQVLARVEECIEAFTTERR